MITLRSGVKVRMEDEDRFSAVESRVGRSWDHIIELHERDTGQKVKGIVIDPKYGITFVLNKV